MEKVFMPFIWAVQWFGKLLRALWKGRSIKDTKLSNEKRKNGWIGIVAIGIIILIIGIVLGRIETGGIGVIISIIGIALSVTPGDMQQLESIMQQSFKNMERMDYLVDSIGDSDNNNIHLRGDAKLVSSMLREEVDYFNQLDFSAFDDSQILSYCKQLLAGYMNAHALMTSFETNAAAFLFKDTEANNTYSICFVHFSQLVQERKELSERLNKERKQMEEELGAIAKSKKVNKKKVAKICKQCVNSETAMQYNQICFEEINLLYDCLVTMQLYETYGKQTMGNDLLKTLLEGLKH